MRSGRKASGRAAGRELAVGVGRLERVGPAGSGARIHPAELSSYAPSAASTFEGVSVWYDDLENGDGYADVLDGVAPVDGFGTNRSQAAHLVQQ